MVNNTLRVSKEGQIIILFHCYFYINKWLNHILLVDKCENDMDTENETEGI